MSSINGTVSGVQIKQPPSFQPIPQLPVLHSSILSEIENTLGQDHPMEHSAAPILNTEPQPAFDDPFDRSDPYFNHCMQHCEYMNCSAAIVRAEKCATTFNKPIKYPCMCPRYKPPTPQIEQIGTAAEDITLDADLTEAEVDALENFDVHEEIVVHLCDAGHFLRDLEESDAIDTPLLHSSPAFTKLSSRQRDLLSTNAVERIRSNLTRYFQSTLLEIPRQSRSISPQALKLEITTYLGIALLDLIQALSRKRKIRFVPDVVEEYLRNPLVNGVWQAWDRAIDALIRLFVLRGIRDKNAKAQSLKKKAANQVAKKVAAIEKKLATEKKVNKEQAPPKPVISETRIKQKTVKRKRSQTFHETDDFKTDKRPKIGAAEGPASNDASRRTARSNWLQRRR